MPSKLKSIAACLLAASAVAASYAFYVQRRDRTILPVRPIDTDPGISLQGGDHRVYVSPDGRRGLLLFLSGTHGSPESTSLFCETAVEEGYDVIGLSYTNQIPASVESGSSDRDAFKKFRLQIIEGGNHSAQVKVSRADSVENRFEKLLVYLAKTRPAERWGSYLDSQSHPKWAQISLSGHSQGAGHVGLMAMRHKAARVIMFGGPKDFDRVRKTPAQWYSEVSATPIDRFFTFNHKRDRQACTFDQQVLNCKALGMVGSPINVDAHKPPFGTSRILYTDCALTTSDSMTCHRSVSADAITPRDKSGKPVFKPVWVYMLTAPFAGAS